MCMCGQGSSPLRQRGEALLLSQRSSARQGECTLRGKTVTFSNSSWTAGVVTVHCRTCRECDVLSLINILHPCFSRLFFLRTLDSPSPPPPLPHTPTSSLLPSSPSTVTLQSWQRAWRPQSSGPISEGRQDTITSHQQRYPHTSALLLVPLALILYKMTCSK